MRIKEIDGKQRYTSKFARNCNHLLMNFIDYGNIKMKMVIPNLQNDNTNRLPRIAIKNTLPLCYIQRFSYMS